MPENTGDTSLDQMRDLDEENGDEGMGTEGAYPFIISCITHYELTARDEDHALELFNEEEAVFIGEGDPIIRRKDS